MQHIPTPVILLIALDTNILLFFLFLWNCNVESLIQIQLMIFFRFLPRYEEYYVHKLPDFVSGSEFIENYDNHDDPFTVIDEKISYAVRAPTRHPVYENFRVKVSKLYRMLFCVFKACDFFRV